MRPVSIHKPPVGNYRNSKTDIPMPIVIFRIMRNGFVNLLFVQEREKSEQKTSNKNVPLLQGSRYDSILQGHNFEKTRNLTKKNTAAMVAVYQP